MMRLFIGILLILTFEIVTSYSASSGHDPHCVNGTSTIVQLFEWKWTDVALECERFISKMGYCGVQLSPVNEHIVIKSPMYPWWQRYQPVSYKLESRSGTEQQLKDMIYRCNKVGVRIFVDAVLNHMVGGGQKGTGWAGSPFDGNSNNFPGVPYSNYDFHDCSQCPNQCSISDWTNHDQVRICRLSGLIDLNQGTDYVRGKMVEFLNKLIGYGVGGFRLDAAKHIYPQDLQAIFSRVNSLNTQFFYANSRPFIYQEVQDFNQNGEIRAQDYTGVGYVTEFRYQTTVQNVINNLGNVDALYDKGWNMLDNEDALVFLNDHDSERDGSKVITFRDPRRYKMGSGLMLAYPYGFPRITSSYNFNSKDDGPPHNSDWSIANVTSNPDGSCGSGWVCEHRWQPVAGMASFRKTVGNSDIRYRWTGNNQAAFGRGGLGFFAITNNGPMNVRLATGMPPGTYCNVIVGCPTNSGCSGGNPVTVNSDSTVQINIEDMNTPLFAIHIGAKAGTASCISR